MRIKKFIGATAKEAAEKMQQEFGKDAVILNTRRLTKGGLLGIGGGDYFEVTGAYDEAPFANPSSETQYPGHNAPLISSRIDPQQGILQPAAENQIAPESGEDVLGSLRQITSKFEEKRKNGNNQNIAPQQPSPRSSSKIESEILRQEIGEVKDALGEIAQHLKHSKMPILPETLKNAYTTLVENEVEEDIALEIVQACNHKLSGAEIDNQSVADAFILKSIASRILESPVRRLERKGYVVALVGPTGVGKTTTVAKLASINKLVKGENVALITADTYRIGAIDQLKAFADIASIPLAVVYTPDEMITAIRKFSGFDTIFIDTVGRSQRSSDKIIELCRFIDAADPNEVHLVFSANFSLATARDIYKKFKAMKPNRLLITKIDEAVSLGLILSLARDSRLPFSFITDGQSVPDDIEPVSGNKLAKMIYSIGVAENA